MDATLFDSYASVIRVLAIDRDPPVTAEVAETITTMNILLLQLRQMKHSSEFFSYQ